MLNVLCVCVSLIFLSIVSASADGGCRLGVLYEKHHVCILFMGSASFHVAESKCVELGGHLPSIHDEDLNDELWKLSCRNSSCKPMWIGMDARRTWIDGSRYNFGRWKHDAPDIWPPRKCAFMLGEKDGDDAEWDLANCLQEYSYACRMEPELNSNMILVDPSSNMSTIYPSIPSDLICAKSGAHHSFDFRTNANPPVMTSSCVLGGHDATCETWLVVVLLVLGNTSDIQERFDTSKSFIKQVVYNCNQKSNLVIITPSSAKNGSQCSYMEASRGVVDTALDALVLNDLVVWNETADAANTVVNMFQALEHCYSNYPRVSSGAVQYFVSSLGCSGLCRENLVQKQVQVIQELVNDGFLLRFIFNKYDPQGTEADCLGRVFYQCNYYPTTCQCAEIVESSCSMDQLATEYATCPSHGGFPINILGIVGSVLLCLGIISCCALRCYRRATGEKYIPDEICCFGKKPDLQRTNLETFQKNATMNNYVDQFEKCDDWEIDIDNLKLFKMIGSGAFASVFAGELSGQIPLAKKQNNLKLSYLRNIDGVYKVAVKKLPPHASDENNTDFLQEIEFMKNLGYHAHILSLLGCSTSAIDPMIIFELCDNGDLLSFVRSKKHQFTRTERIVQPGELRIKDLISIAWQVADGMEYLKSKNFIHRDIAARNVLLTEDLTAKIGDFGLCRLVDTALYNARGGMLPIKWMAPESMKYYEYSFKSDIWSFGILLFEMFSLGEAPYQTIQPTEMRGYLDKGGRLEQPEMCPNEIYEIMKNCWMEQPDDRPAVEEVRQTLSKILNSNSESYGYLVMEDREIRLDSIQEEDSVEAAQ